ncbi:hypothetical protein GH714_033116 [Hevea brasiliensis]|uniref:Uncharacterized protein n=1 Tax=Hevea brasiliensis TaxID=3981 RepID=A0A6A6L622_HEVBR|nr:hypothetical protein GH714_033116 [Hevea brasiliensis]
MAQVVGIRGVVSKAEVVLLTEEALEVEGREEVLGVEMVQTEALEAEGGGRRDHSSWNENNDSGETRPSTGRIGQTMLAEDGKLVVEAAGTKEGDGDGNDGGWKTSGGSWNQRGADKAFDWKNGTNNDGKGWKTSGGSWNQGGADNSQPRRLDSKNDESSNQAGGWGKGTNAGGESNDSWGKSSASSWGNKGDGNDVGWKTSGGSWSQRGADEGNGNQAGGWGKDTNAGGEPSDSGGKAPGSSWGKGRRRWK